MIELIGEEGTSEYIAALSIKKGFEDLWPGIGKSPAEEEIIKIVAGVKISGYEVGDIDVVVSGNFQNGRKFIPNKLLHDNAGDRVIKKPVEVKNFVVAVEVKDHDEDRIQLNGDNVLVRYKDRWKSASDQNIKQVHALVSYFKDLGRTIFVHRCLVMRGLSRLRVGGAVASGFTGVDFLTAVAAVSRVHKTGRGYQFSSSSNAEIGYVIDAPIFRLLMPSNLDRRRMDAIVATSSESQEIYQHLGNRMVRLRGHGGAGKTIMLLQAAWRAFNEQGKRSVVLTYNVALAADIRRSLALLRVPTESDSGGIVVKTVMSFMYSWFNRLGLIQYDGDIDLGDYVSQCETALEMLGEGVITQSDIDQAIDEYPDAFDFDCVIVDEAQDWPQAEAELLKLLYRPENIALADGIDQLVRGGRTNWDKSVNPDLLVTQSLTRCLRMKQNLATFCNQVAFMGGLKWEVKPNTEATGGRVILLSKPFYDFPELVQDLLDKAKNKGNSEVDFLVCVPPNGVVEQNGQKLSVAGKMLRSQGYSVWDGVDANVRNDFPRSLDQIRIVQYESCRGLEGWTVILHAADVYWESVKSRRLGEGLSEEQEQSFLSIDDISVMDAWLKSLISLTRPIDTLVIDLSDLQSEYARIMQRIAKKYPDIVLESGRTH